MSSLIAKREESVREVERKLEAERKLIDEMKKQVKDMGKPGDSKEGLGRACAGLDACAVM